MPILGAQSDGLRIQAPCWFPFIKVMAEPMSADTSVMLPGTIMVLLVRASWL